MIKFYEGLRLYVNSDSPYLKSWYVNGASEATPAKLNSDSVYKVKKVFSYNNGSAVWLHITDEDDPLNTTLLTLAFDSRSFSPFKLDPLPVIPWLAKALEGNFSITSDKFDSPPYTRGSTDAEESKT